MPYDIVNAPGGELRQVSPVPPPESISGSPKPFRRSSSRGDVQPLASADTQSNGGQADCYAAPVIDRRNGSGGHRRGGSGGERGGSGGRRRRHPRGMDTERPAPSAHPPGRARLSTPEEPGSAEAGAEMCISPNCPDVLTVLVRSEEDDRYECDESEGKAWMRLQKDWELGKRIVEHVSRFPKQENPFRPDSGAKDALSDKYVKTGRVLGRGAYATVYEGYDEDTGRFIAIKEIQFISDSEEIERKIQRIASEVRMMKRLQDKHIVRYLGAGRERNLLRIYTEYVSGGSLTTLLRARGRGFAEKTVRVYTRQILKGLIYLHDQGILHRDIKGDNVLLEKTTGRVKLSDFNSSKELMEQSLDHGAGTFVGTPWYMAPEIIQSRNYGLPADIWSLGCTVIEMLTANPPWSRELKEATEISGKKVNSQNLFAAMYRIAQTEIEPDIPNEVSPECRQFILQECMQRTPSERWKARELLQKSWFMNLPSGASTVAESEHAAPSSARSGRSSVVSDYPASYPAMTSPGIPPSADGSIHSVSSRGALPGRRLSSGPRVTPLGRAAFSEDRDTLPLSALAGSASGTPPSTSWQGRPQTLPPDVRPPSGGSRGCFAREMAASGNGRHADVNLLGSLDRFQSAKPVLQQRKNAFDELPSEESARELEKQLAEETKRLNLYRGGPFKYEARRTDEQLMVSSIVQ